MKRYIYLMRHGSPDFPDDEKRCLGSTDIGLSDYGKWQMTKLKDWIRAYPWNKVYASPMVRCLETADCLGLSREELIIKHDLREMAAGIWENLTFKEIKEKYPDLYEERGKSLGTFAVEGGESFQAAGERFEKCLNEIRKETNDHVLIIAHAGSIRGYLCSLTGKNYNEVMDFPMPYGGLSILEEKEGKIRLVETGIRSAELLDEDEIHRIYKKCRTPEHIVAHMEKVAETAFAIMNDTSLSCSFTKEEQMLIKRAALLHDILRKEEDHAIKGAEFIRKEGYPEVAQMVELHHSTVVNEKNHLEMHELLFFADKLVQGGQLVSFEERFAKSYEKCKGNPEAERKHRLLYEKTREISKKIYGTSFIEEQ